MKTKIKILLIVVLIIAYFLTINILPSLLEYQSYYISNGTEIVNTGDYEKVGVGDVVNVNVIRPRWFGTIFEANGMSNLKLFNLIWIPLTYQNFNFLFIHLIFLFLFLLIILSKTNKKTYETPLTTNDQLTVNWQ